MSITTTRGKKLQDILDQSGNGATLALDPPREEFAGPLIISTAVTIEGHGGSIWASAGPVVQIRAHGVVLRDLSIEITSRDSNLSGDSACALKIAPGLPVDLHNVVVHGMVSGLAEEEGNWHLPRILMFGSVRATIPHEFRLKVVTPVACMLTSDIDGLNVEPRDLNAGVNEVTLRLDPLPAGTRLRGQLQLRTRHLSRRIAVNAHFTDNGATGNGQCLWPQGEVLPPPDTTATAATMPSVPALTLPLEPVLISSPTQPANLPMPSLASSSATGAVSPPAGPETLIVSLFETGEYRSIGEALQHARTGARILVRPGVYRENLTLHKRVEIVGDGPASEIILESTDGNCLVLQADLARLANLTFRGAAGRSGRERYAIHVPHGQLILEGCHVTSDSLACLAVAGAGAALVLRRCRVQGGASTGVLVLDQAGAVLEDCDVSQQALAGVESSRGGSLTIRNSRLFACGQTGVLIHNRGVAILEACDVHGHARAGIETRESGEVVLNHCRVHGNQGPGLLVLTDGKARLEDCDLFDNTLANLEVRLGGNPTLRRCKLRQGKQAGALFSRDAQGTLEDCELTGNARAAVEIKENANPTLRRCSIRRCGDVGVSVRDRGRGVLEECDLAEAQLAVLDIRKSAAPHLKRCKIHDGAKAGVLAASRSAGRMDACEIFANQGPGVVITGESNLTLKSCKVHENALVGVVVCDNGRGVLEQCEICDNGLAGVMIRDGGAPAIKGCRLSQNRDVGLWAQSGAEGTVEDCDLTGNRGGPLDLEGGARSALSDNRTGE